MKSIVHQNVYGIFSLFKIVIYIYVHTCDKAKGVLQQTERGNFSQGIGLGDF